MNISLFNIKFCVFFVFTIFAFSTVSYSQIIPMSCNLSVNNSENGILCNDQKVELISEVNAETDVITISINGKIFESRILEDNDNEITKTVIWSEDDYEELQNLEFTNHNIEIVTEDSDSGSACFIFLSFSYEECESSGNPIDIPTLYPFEISVKLLLQANYNRESNMLSNTSNALGLLPLDQPFNDDTFNYTGEEQINTIDAEAVDWVLISIRNEIGVVLDKVAALLYTDGTVRNSAGSTKITFNEPQPLDAKYFISVDHKSHLCLMTNDAYGSDSSIDFTQPNITSGQSQTITIDNKEFMLAGDFDGNCIINNLDYNVWASNSAAVAQYLAHDVDGNGIINNLDFNFWALNRNKIGERRLFENSY